MASSLNEIFLRFDYVRQRVSPALSETVSNIAGDSLVCYAASRRVPSRRLHRGSVTMELYILKVVTQQVYLSNNFLLTRYDEFSQQHNFLLTTGRLKSFLKIEISFFITVFSVVTFFGWPKKVTPARTYCSVRAGKKGQPIRIEQSLRSTSPLRIGDRTSLLIRTIHRWKMRASCYATQREALVFFA
jgi:hypothetical protein